MISDQCRKYDLFSGEYCYRPAVVDVVAGCVHEHVGARSFCHLHERDIPEGTMYCGDCVEAGCFDCLLHQLGRALPHVRPVLSLLEAP